MPALLPDFLYACDPEKPTQNGQVGYMNKLIRQYIPKAINLRNITQAKLDWIANELKRPRKRLGWFSPDKLRFNMTAAPICWTSTYPLG